MDTPTPADFEAVGLYDPSSPTAADRLAMLELFARRGISIERMADAAASGRLVALGLDEALGSGGGGLSVEDLARRVGASVETLERCWRALGLATSPSGSVTIGESDFEAAALFELGIQLVGEEAAIGFMRTLGTSLARVAEHAVTTFLTEVQDPLDSVDAGELALAEANVRGIEVLVPVASAIESLFLVQTRLAIERFRHAGADAGVLGVAHLAVGFVDLVGYTTLSRELDARELAGLIGEFETRAYDAVTRSGGWVVKLIGDEVMFAALDAPAALRIACDLTDCFTDDAVTPRGGIAIGDIVVRGGDYYGPVVNLAARTAEVAIPGEVLVTQDVEAVATAVDAPFRFESAGRRLLKGFSEPVALYSAGHR